MKNPLRRFNDLQSCESTLSKGWNYYRINVALAIVCSVVWMVAGIRILFQ